MKIQLLNWSNSKEILEHSDNIQILDSILNTIKNAPHFQFKGKSNSKTAKDRIDTCQEHLNSYFDYSICSFGWELQPSISIGSGQRELPNIDLKADFRKVHEDRVFQIEVQCGNNSRFYADLIKFQMAWLQKLTDVAILIVPMNAYAQRMGENICNFERLSRELPYLRPVLQLPILVVGFEPSKKTRVIDLRKTSYSFLARTGIDLKTKYSLIKTKENRNRNIQALILDHVSINDIDENYPIDRDLIPKSHN